MSKTTMRAFAQFACATIAFTDHAFAGSLSAKLTPMPAALEGRFALSALPPALRDGATIYLLDTAKGYVLARKGASGIECLVERTQWEQRDFRDDIYFAICYDAEGSRTLLRVVRDAAEMRAAGISSGTLKARIEGRFANKTYIAPTRGGVSYMMGPIMRTNGPPDLKVRTMAMPHLMFYAPGVSNADLGAKPVLNDFSSLMSPFIDRQGNAQQSYIIQMIGQSEKMRILADESKLVSDLCAYRSILCLEHHSH